MKKRVMITVIILAMAIAGTGCGAKSNSSEAAQAETTVKEEKEETVKSNKQDINTDEINTNEINTNEINNGNTASEDLIQGEGESDTNTTKNEVSNDSAKSSKDASTTTDKKAATVTTGSNTTTNNTTAAESNSGKNNNTQQNTNSSSSNNNSSTQTESTQATHTHTWQHIEATGHYETVIVQEAWDEEAPVYENVAHSICNVCGADVTGNTASHAEAHALAYEGSGHHTEWRYEQTGTQTVHHNAVTEQKWIQDSQAYDKCTTCGEIK